MDSFTKNMVSYILKTSIQPKLENIMLGGESIPLDPQDAALILDILNRFLKDE